MHRVKNYSTASDDKALFVEIFIANSSRSEQTRRVIVVSYHLRVKLICLKKIRVG